MVATICAQTMLNGETIRLDGALRMAPSEDCKGGCRGFDEREV